MKGSSGIPGKDWFLLCQKYDWRCVWCGAETALVVDHVIPVSKGGADSIDNVQPLCRPCNSSKGDQVLDFRLSPFQGRTPRPKLAHVVHEIQQTQRSQSAIRQQRRLDALNAAAIRAGFESWTKLETVVVNGATVEVTEMTAGTYSFKYMEHTTFPQGNPPHMTVVYHLNRGKNFTGIEGFLRIAVPETQDWNDITRISTSAVKTLESEFLTTGISDDDSAEDWIKAHRALAGT